MQGYIINEGKFEIKGWFTFDLGPESATRLSGLHPPKLGKSSSFFSWSPPKYCLGWEVVVGVSPWCSFFGCFGSSADPGWGHSRLSLVTSESSAKARSPLNSGARMVVFTCTSLLMSCDSMMESIC